VCCKNTCCADWLLQYLYVVIAQTSLGHLPGLEAEGHFQSVTKCETVNNDLAFVLCGIKGLPEKREERKLGFRGRHSRMKEENVED
jgi:hypothetical protein